MNDLSNTYKQNPLDDDHLFTPSTAIRTPKPRLSPPRNNINTNERYDSDDIPSTVRTEPESAIPMNFNATIRQPMSELNNLDWLKDPEPTTTTVKRNSLHEIEEYHSKEKEEHDDNDEVHHHDHDHERRKSSAEFNDNDDPNTYGSNEFDESVNSDH